MRSLPALSAAALAALVAAHDLAKTPGSVCAIAFCALVAFRRRQPVLVATMAAAVLALAAVSGGSLAALNDTAAPVPMGIALAMFSYTLGAKPPLRWSLLGLAALVIGVEVTSTGGFNPLPAVVATGSLVAGCLIGSHQRAAALLRARATELEEEEELFVTESVRRERMRIAHEFHDIVAHCISLTVVQAEAGQRVATVDPDGAAAALRFIADAARQAGGDIDRLIAFLADPGSERGAGMELIEALVERVRASGAPVRCRLAEDFDQLTERECHLMYRVVQEALTNAVKHAPGAEVEVAASASAHTLELRVENRAAVTRRTSLASTGGGNGLLGMRQRIEAAGGTLSAGPSAAGGWIVRMVLPLMAPAKLTEVR